MPELLSWHSMPPQDAVLALESSTSGLSSKEVETRLEKYGPNQLRVEKPTSAVKIFLRQFFNPLMFVLGIAVLLSAGLGKYSDVVLTFVVILINVLMGFVQEYRADRALYALKTFLPHLVSVRRNGKVATIPAEELVPGDIVLVAAGTKMAADARLLSAKDLAANESALTGESAEVAKKSDPVAESALVADRSSMVFAGSTIVSGKAEAVVVATGRSTEFGKVTELVAEMREELTPLQTELLKLSRALVWVMLAAAVAVFLLGFARGISVYEMLATSAALAVAAVPEGLLVSVTVILTVGMRRMLKRDALVRRLVAAETLGSATILCVDKTGTLTTGEMTVVELRSGVSLLDLEQLNDRAKVLLQDLYSVNAAQVEEVRGQKPRIMGSPTESGIMHFLLERGNELTLEKREAIDELPFDSDKKFSAKLFRGQGIERALVMGAPDVLLSRCDIDDRELQAYRATLEDMTHRGLRVLLLAEKMFAQTPAAFSEDVLRDLSPRGLIGLEDPLRETAHETVLQAQAAGVRIVMITGDHPVTATAIATQLGLPTQEQAIMLGSDLDALKDEELALRLRNASVFARVLPEQKLRIVQAFQSLGYTVAMTGDGVNDAPALRAADIGVAVGSGTEVAKETADMVILDNDVESLVAAIREGRIIFDNIRKVLAYLLTFSMSEVVFIASVLALGLPVPFAPLHILWINLVTDGLPSVALAFEPGESTVMQEPPRSRREPILTPGMIRLMFFAGSIAVFGLLLVYVQLFSAAYDMESLRTIAFLSLGLDSLLAIFAMRSFRLPFWRVGLFTNKELLWAICAGFSLLMLPALHPGLREIFGFTVLGRHDIALLFSVALIKLLFLELGKAWFLGNIRKPKQVLVS